MVHFPFNVRNSLATTASKLINFVSKKLRGQRPNVPVTQRLIQDVVSKGGGLCKTFLLTLIYVSHLRAPIMDGLGIVKPEEGGSESISFPDNYVKRTSVDGKDQNREATNGLCGGLGAEGCSDGSEPSFHYDRHDKNEEEENAGKSQNMQRCRMRRWTHKN